MQFGWFIFCHLYGVQERVLFCILVIIFILLRDGACTYIHEQVRVLSAVRKKRLSEHAIARFER